MEEFLIMRGFDLGVFAALWTLFSRFAFGQHVGGGEAITYSRELLLALRPLAVSDNILHIPQSLRISSLQAAASGILPKKHVRKEGRHSTQTGEIWSKGQTPAPSATNYSSLKRSIHSQQDG